MGVGGGLWIHLQLFNVCVCLQIAKLNIPNLLVQCTWTEFPGVDLCLSNLATQQDRWDFNLKHSSRQDLN